MKIAIFNKYQFKVNRGAETFVDELFSRLSRKHRVQIFTEINLWNLLTDKYDIYIPTNGRLQAFLIRIISKIKGAKMIVSGQSGPGLDDRLNLYAFPDVFVALTMHQEAWANKINPFVKVVVIPNGVDLNKFTPSKSKIRNKILAAGAFTENKRHDLTIKATAMIPGVKLTIVGSQGEAESDLKELGRKLLKDNFEMVSVKHESMPQIYKSASVLAFPTVPWESFGIVMLEAMASGIPVVATKDPIRSEIIGSAGMLVNPENLNEYADALKTTMERNWKNLPRLQAEKFSWDNIGERYLKLIEEITQK
jgi:glycosyltransferase involved in cell wall biosynthesis